MVIGQRWPALDARHGIEPGGADLLDGGSMHRRSASSQIEAWRPSAMLAPHQRVIGGMEFDHVDAVAAGVVGLAASAILELARRARSSRLASYPRTRRTPSRSLASGSKRTWPRAALQQAGSVMRRRQSTSATGAASRLKTSCVSWRSCSRSAISGSPPRFYGAQARQSRPTRIPGTKCGIANVGACRARARTL